LSDNQIKILQTIKKNKLVTQKHLSEEIGINEKNIRNNISILKQKGIIERIGSDRKGYWNIITEEN